MNLVACHSTKNCSHCIDLLTCVNFVSAYDPESLRGIAQNQQHFLITCDFAAFNKIKIGNGRFGNVSSLKGGGR